VLKVCRTPSPTVCSDKDDTVSVFNAKCKPNKPHKNKETKGNATVVLEALEALHVHA